jgi:hypothetical protein
MALGSARNWIAVSASSKNQASNKKMKTKNLTTLHWLAAIFGCGFMLISLGSTSAQQPLRPELILDVGAPEEVNAQPNFVMAQPRAPFAIPFRSTMGDSAYAAAKQRANSAYAPGVTKSFPLAPTVLGPPVIKTNNFNGHSETEGLFPPDTHGAIGVNHFVEVTNSHFDVFSKASPPALVKSVTLATFFNYTAETLFDPRVVYDQTWQRWIVTADAFPESTTVQRLFIGISKTSDPTGPFFIYNIDVDFFNNNDFYDFPQLGIDQDAVLFTANIFPAAGGFRGADFFSIAKARLYNGLGFSVPIFTGLAATLAPPVVLDQNASTFLIAAPPSGTTLTKYTATNTSHPSSTRLVQSTVTVPSYGVPPDAHQSGTSQVLDTSDSRFVNASTQNGTDLWQTHTIALGPYPAPKFYRLNTSTNAVRQSGFYFASHTSDDFNASITANAAGNCFVTWTSTDASIGVNAQVRLSGKLSADAQITAGTAGFTSPTFLTGNFDPRFGTQRWGDYSAVTLDPSNVANAWLVNEKINNNSIWGSRIITIGF